MYEKFQIFYETTKEISFWLVGVWLLIVFAPIILPIMMIIDYMENN